MPNEKKSPGPCEMCGVKDAIHFITNTVDGLTTRHRFCDACTVVAKEKSREKKCESCGESPCYQNADFFGIIGNITTREIWRCFPCTMEYASYLHAEFARIPEGLVEADHVAAMLAIGKEAEAHMKLFVTMRDR